MAASQGKPAGAGDSKLEQAAGDGMAASSRSKRAGMAAAFRLRLASQQPAVTIQSRLAGC